MTQEKLREVLEAHKRWLNSDGKEVEKADLHGTDLINADLHGADLSNADLSNANLSNANLSYADLREADLHEADLREAELINTDLRNADLSNADLREADLRGANLDWSCLPLWRGSLSTHFDDRELKQIAYHLVKAGLLSKNVSEETKRELEKLIDFANGFHRAEDYGKITKLSEV